jgi:NADH-quinone oxidoreductase subunit N
MSAPVIWIFLPAISALGLVFISRTKRLTVSLGIGLALCLSGLAHWLTIGSPIRILRFSFQISDTLTILGRRFVLDNASRPALFAIYLVTAFWLGGVLTAKVGRLSVPLAMVIVASLTAALAVDPFLYAGLLIEMAVLAAIPMLSPPSRSPGRGVLRFLVYQTLGMMLLLFTGWIMAGVEASPADTALAARAAVFLGLGFALLLAVIPFHTWVPMLAAETHPYTAALIFLVLPEIIIRFGLGFLDRYAWLRQTSGVYLALRLAGTASIFVAGWWSASQRHLGRVFGFAVLVEIGYSLLAIGIADPLPLSGTASTTAGLPTALDYLLPRALGFGVYALALSALKARTGGLDFRQVQGAAHALPLAAAASVLAQFSLAGLPLLAGFPFHLAVWQTAGEQFQPLLLWLLLGSAGLVVGGLRSLATLVTPPAQARSERPAWQVSETPAEALLMGAGLVALFLVGLFPL